MLSNAGLVGTTSCSSLRLYLLPLHLRPALVPPRCISPMHRSLTHPQEPAALLSAFDSGPGNLLEVPGGGVQLSGTPVQTTIEEPVGDVVW